MSSFCVSSWSFSLTIARWLTPSRSRRRGPERPPPRGTPAAVKNFLEQYGEEQGCTTVLLDNTTESNLESQRAAVENWVTQGVDSILLWPVDESAFTSLQKQAQDQGIKWLTYASPMEGEDGGVGFDSDESGQAIADEMSAWIAENYPDGDVSAAVTEITALGTLSGRWEKPAAQLEADGIEVVSQQNCADQACGLQIAEDALRENPNLRVFIGVNDDVALGAKKAFDNAGIDPETVFIAGSDGTPDALAAIKNGGAFRVTAAIPPAPLADDILQVSLAAITGEGETNRQTPPVLVRHGDDATIDELLAQFD
ncbi:MAG: sugar ABC transporter substrate-binding protein [Herbiconiux sp.]|nr:MAG: sugar ABC transporter substrate-binding protein [Herbiconiux sp.]